MPPLLLPLVSALLYIPLKIYEKFSIPPRKDKNYMVYLIDMTRKVLTFLEEGAAIC